MLGYLATKYGTDKKPSDHGYTPFYENYLSEIRLVVQSMLEVGVNDGRSLKMWEDYFPNATIYGVDINTVNPAFEHRGSTQTYQMCQSEKEKLKETFSEKRLEVIVDDASHDCSKTLETFDALFPLLVNGGYYFIEDMNWSFASTIYEWLNNHRDKFGSLNVHSDAPLGSTLIVANRK